MKTELFKKVYIRSEADLPKEEGVYFAHSVMSKISLIQCTLNDLIIGNGVYDWYLQPISETQLNRERIIKVLNKHLGYSTAHYTTYEIAAQIRRFDKIADELTQGQESKVNLQKIARASMQPNG
jgi:hypothetical protein